MAAVPVWHAGLLNFVRDASAQNCHPQPGGNSSSQIDLGSRRACSIGSIDWRQRFESNSRLFPDPTRPHADVPSALIRPSPKPTASRSARTTPRLRSTYHGLQPYVGQAAGSGTSDHCGGQHSKSRTTRAAPSPFQFLSIRKTLPQRMLSWDKNSHGFFNESLHRGWLSGSNGKNL